MTLLGKRKYVPENSSNGKPRTYLILKCDFCGVEFERWQNAKLISERPRHYCGFEHHNMAMKSGGIADESRKKTCKEKYGSDYYILTEESLKKASEHSTSDEANKKRYATRRKNLQEVTIQLKRGLYLCRSRAEIDFLAKLAAELGSELIYQKYVNGWWIDAYSPTYDCWIQFDGVYWHSKDGARARDEAQNVWFTQQNMRLIRVTDKQALQPGIVSQVAALVVNRPVPTG